MPKSNLEKEARWRKILGQQQASGQGVRPFCQEHQLSEPSFYAWRREIARRDRKAAVSTGRKRTRDQENKGKPQASGAFFLPLRLASGAVGSIELVHPRGHVLRIPAGFDVECLQAVLGLLDRGQGA